MQEPNPENELMELKHDPWPGFRTAFYIVMGLASIYLLVVFLNDPDGALRNPHYGHEQSDSHESVEEPASQAPLPAHNEH